jgi:hypothetical protein
VGTTNLLHLFKKRLVRWRLKPVTLTNVTGIRFLFNTDLAQRKRSWVAGRSTLPICSIDKKEGNSLRFGDIGCMRQTQRTVKPIT